MRALLATLAIAAAIVPAAQASRAPHPALPQGTVSGHAYIDVYQFGVFVYSKPAAGIYVGGYERKVTCDGRLVACPPAEADATTTTDLTGAFRLSLSELSSVYVFAMLRDRCATGFTYYFSAGGWSTVPGTINPHIPVDLDQAC